MRLHDFIFSDKRNHRLSRHIAFWLVWYIIAMTVQLNFPAYVNNYLGHQFLRSTNRLVTISFFCYVSIYLIIPRFIASGKFKQFLLAMLALMTVSYLFTFLWLYFMVNILHSENWFNHSNTIIKWETFTFFFFGFYSNINFSGAFPTACIMLAVKYYKNWYKKQQEGEMLIQENAQAELQLLKAQVHPHFLFNTLNNIYSFSLKEPFVAAELVDKLTGMIDYMRTEGEKPLVSLEKEIQLITDYIGLEKVRYGERLEMKIQIIGDFKNKQIAPLLMIPFVENAFKHGAGKIRGKQWIHLLIESKNNQLVFELSNSKESSPAPLREKSGIGLSNVRKRLALLYPDNYKLDTIDEADTYAVKMKVLLYENSTIEIPQDQINYSSIQNISYA